jgi:hypothetical protein
MPGLIFPLQYTVKKVSDFPNSPVGISLIKLSLAGKNLIIPRHGIVWLVTSRPGTGKNHQLFLQYTVVYSISLKKFTGRDLEGSLNLLHLLCDIKNIFTLYDCFCVRKPTQYRRKNSLKEAPHFTVALDYTSQLSSTNTDRMPNKK